MKRMLRPLMTLPRRLLLRLARHDRRDRLRPLLLAAHRMLPGEDARRQTPDVREDVRRQTPDASPTKADATHDPSELSSDDWRLTSSARLASSPFVDLVIHT